MTSVQRPQDTKARIENLERRLGVLERASVPYRIQPVTQTWSWTVTNSNSWTRAVSIPSPTWTESVTLWAVGLVTCTDPNIRVSSTITIDGSTGPASYGTTPAAGMGLTYPVMHSRTWSPQSADFAVSITGGAAPVGATPTWTVQLTTLSLFSKN